MQMFPGWKHLGHKHGHRSCPRKRAAMYAAWFDNPSGDLPATPVGDGANCGQPTHSQPTIDSPTSASPLTQNECTVTSESNNGAICHKEVTAKQGNYKYFSGMTKGHSWPGHKRLASISNCQQGNSKESIQVEESDQTGEGQSHYSNGGVGRQSSPSNSRTLNQHADGESPSTRKPTIASVALLLLIADGVHNFMDGLAIGSGFTHSVSTGVGITLAVFAEEIPHEVNLVLFCKSSLELIYETVAYAGG